LANVNIPQPVVMPNAVATAQIPPTPPVPHNVPTAHSYHPRFLGGKVSTDSSSIFI